MSANDSLFASDSSRLLPLFWLRGESEDRLRAGVRAVRASGCGALVAESRTHPDFLGDGWWRDISVLLDECKREGLKLWVLDDAHFPSGYAAGSAAGTPYCRMMLTERHLDVRGPVRGGQFIAVSDETSFREGEGLVAVIAARRLEKTTRVEAFKDIGGWCLGELVDLTDTVRDGMASWDVPQGIWRVFVLTARYVSERTPPRYFVNPLLPQGGQLMIDTVYRPHFERFGGEFGKTFMGFFSDEPALRAGKGYRAVMGEYPQLPIPWRADMTDILRRRAGRDVRALLPGLWYDIGGETRGIRCLVMDTVSRLYGDNYSAPIGRWCREHGAMYIGHVIEQNNAHTRLGSGAGHYFRAVGGQDMSGIDIVLHEIIPELRGGSHAWNSQDFEADDDFFRYMLGQMAVSAASIDPKKRGRTVCEIFGAYGWQEDVFEMRYLADLMLSRGVNHFSPHAFTLADFPDPDSPGHFDAAHQPLMPFISELFGAMARTAELIDGGRRLTRAAVLYNAESEWACGTGGSMRSQDVVKILNSSQIECTVIPMESLEESRELYDLLFIPEADAWPASLSDILLRLTAEGVRVRFIGKLPELFDDGVGSGAPWPSGAECVELADAAKTALAQAPLPYRAAVYEPRVHLYPYEKDGELRFLLMNEDTRESVGFSFTVDSRKTAYVLDLEERTCRLCPAAPEGAGQRLTLGLDPGQLLAVVLTDRDLPADPWPPALGEARTLDASWSVSLRAAESPEFTPLCKTGTLFNITAPDCRPRFSGTVGYEAEVELSQAAAISLGECWGAARLWLDGRPAGTRTAPPYTFYLPETASGAHRLRVEVTNTPVFAHRDARSFFSVIKPTGMLGPVRALRAKTC